MISDYKFTEKLVRLVNEKEQGHFRCALWSLLNKNYECPAFCTGCTGYDVENERWEIFRYV